MMSSLEWDENACRGGTTDRAKQECLKRTMAYLAVRQPQEKLDPRILELAKNRTLPFEEIPYLHYGLKVSPKSFEPCIERNGIEVDVRGTPEYDEEEDMMNVLEAIKKFLQDKGGLTIRIVFPLEERNDHFLFLFALDNTDTLRHQRFIKEWKKYADDAVQVIRDELGLGDQKAMWWWDSQYGVGYTSPIPDYNPPQINPKPAELQPRKRIHFDFDSSDSESGSDTV